MNSPIITYWDWLLAPFYILVIYVIASRIKNKEIKKNPIYKYFLWGLFAKIFGAISVCLVYVYYYKTGGDTLAYHASSKVMVNLFYYEPVDFLKVLFGNNTKESYYYFNNETGFPIYMWDDKYAWNVVRFTTPFEIIGLRTYIVTSILIAVLSYTGIWQLYKMFCEIFPELYKYFAVCILFFPSVVFWGSGIMKDSWTLSATGWFAYSFYNLFIMRRRIMINAISIIIASFILLLIKPYIFIALMPGCLLWGIWTRIITIKSVIIKFLSIPFILVLGAGGGFVVWDLVSSDLGDFSSIDSMIKKAYVSSDDLKQAYYQGNSFDLGAYDPTIQGVLSKFPIAAMTGIFRPFLWEVKNIVMLVSGLETFFLLCFTLFVLFRKPAIAVKKLFSNPVVLFCLLFSICFAFSVAISTSNFGAMVRLRIPMLPFFACGLIIIEYGKIQSMQLKQ